MPVFSNPDISIAAIDDIPAIKDLLNSAYRGETSRQGWTTEADLIAGETRTDEQDLMRVMETKRQCVFKIYQRTTTDYGLRQPATAW